MNCDIIWSIRDQRPTVTLLIDTLRAEQLDAVEQIVKGDSPVPISVNRHSLGGGTVFQIQAGDLHRGDGAVPRIVRSLSVRLESAKLKVRISHAVAYGRVA